MTLLQFISALKTDNVLLTLVDSDANEICRIYNKGADALDDALEAREVSKWIITGANAVTVTVKDATP